MCAACIPSRYPCLAASLYMCGGTGEKSVLFSWLRPLYLRHCVVLLLRAAPFRRLVSLTSVIAYVLRGVLSPATWARACVSRSLVHVQLDDA